MRQILKRGLCLLCSANLTLWSTPGWAGEQQRSHETAAKAEQPETTKEHALKAAEQIGSRVLVTMADGTQRTLKDLMTSGERFENLVFHIPEYNLHLRMKAKPAKDHFILVFQILDAQGHETDRMTQVTINPNADQASLFSHLKDSMRVLSATAETTKTTMTTGPSRLPAAACGHYQTHEEQFRNLLFDISLLGSGLLMTILATGPDFAFLKLPVFLLGGSLALYGLRLIHSDLLPPCPQN